MSCINESVNIAVKALDAKSAREIQVLDVRGLTTITDYFVIATGGSAINVQAICDRVEEDMHKAGEKLLNKEGYDSASWILLGYSDVIVHIFQGETREFYKLEHIWKDADVIDISDLLTE